MTTIVWFRQDLRLSDNPALFEAARRGPVLPVFVLEDPEKTGDPHPLGGASRWWLHHSLAALSASLPGLVIARGAARDVLPDLARRTGADAVFWNRCYEPHAIARDTDLKGILKEEGINVASFNGSLLQEPWEVRTRTGGPFKVYSPFWRALRQMPVAAPLPAPPDLRCAQGGQGLALADLDLLPDAPNWADGWEHVWQPGESGAQGRLDTFLEAGLAGYKDLRNRPDLPNVSRLSPHLHFGEISPRQVWAAAQHKMAQTAGLQDDAMSFLSEIAWREFSYHLLFHYPDLPARNWKPGFDAYPWRDSPQDLRRWRRGETGYPIVDAGMRELWRTGYMHNRVRMIAASFLVKHLRLHWSHGEAWFRDTLVDADLASNSASWQWVAGSGADAAPYFRIFNPITQGTKFDPDGAYTRQWLPELDRVPDRHLFAPFDAPPAILAQAGVRLGETYPLPIVDHAAARKAALDGYEVMRKGTQSAA